MTDDHFLSLYFADNLGKHVIYSLYASLHRERRHVSERVITGGRAVQQVMPVFVFPETEAALYRISDTVHILTLAWAMCLKRVFLF